MKKFLRNFIALLITIIALVVCISNIYKNLYVDKSLLTSEEYTSGYYYNQLTDEQKLIYLRLDTRIKNVVGDIHLGFIKNLKAKLNVDAAITAIYNDKPEYYYLPQDYNVKTIKFGPVEYTTVNLKYTVEDLKEKQKMDLKLKNVIDTIVYETITDDDMPEIEKEIRLHDALVNRVVYYTFENIQDIPISKHTSYEALINDSAVCDGIAKAYKLLLDKVGIYSIIVSGELGDVAHAWNVVKIEDEYYHVDVTSNTVDLNGKRHVMHRYFNLTDEEIKRTHIVDELYKLEACNFTKYNYFNYMGYYIEYEEDFKNKLREIINKQYSQPIVEFRLTNLYSTEDLLEEMYYLNYNNWEDERQDVVKYYQIEDIYIFENKNKKKLY